MEKHQEISVFYDGLCMLCSKEIEHYKKQPGAERIRFVDICGPGFNATQEGVDPQEVHRVMHVRRADGSLAIKVDAFIEIWKVLPPYHFAARLAKKPWTRPVLDLGYQGFSIIRPYLPRYKNLNCDDSPYCEMPTVKPTKKSRP